MRRILIVLLMMGIQCAVAQAQETPTPTPTETPTLTPTPEPWIYATLSPPAEGESGQMTRFDYTYTAGDVMVSSILLFLAFSLWGMFIFVVIAWSRNG